MSPTWRSDQLPQADAVGGLGWIRVALRGGTLGLLVFGGLLVLLLIRLIEAPIFRSQRPISPWITVFVCRGALRVLGVRLTLKGRADPSATALVANHGSWLDIFTLNATQPLYFVSKGEVRDWPGIGWLARATGTVFISRDRKQASAEAEQLTRRLSEGHKLLFFPEGTSSDSLRVLPFRSSLFAAFFAPDLEGAQHVQPITVRYAPPEDADARFYGWWGDMTFGPHLLKLLAAPRQGSVRVTFHPSIAVSAHPNRKSLTSAAEAAVRAGFDVSEAAP